MVIENFYRIFRDLFGGVLGFFLERGRGRGTEASHGRKGVGEDKGKE